jgi:hypothetical protein
MIQIIVVKVLAPVNFLLIKLIMSVFLTVLQAILHKYPLAHANQFVLVLIMVTRQQELASQFAHLIILSNQTEEFVSLSALWSLILTQPPVTVFRRAQLIIQ